VWAQYPLEKRIWYVPHVPLLLWDGPRAKGERHVYDFLVRRGAAIAFYLYATAAQVSGYANTLFAILLGIAGTMALFFPTSHHTKAWYRSRIGGAQTRVELPFPIVLGLVGAWLAFTIALGAVLWRQYWSPAVAAVHTTTAPVATRANVTTLLPNTDDGIIKWVPNYLLAARSINTGIEISGFQATGQNESDEFIEPIGGFVRSEITGRQFPILVSDGGNLVSPRGYGIPAKHQFQLGARFVESGGMSVTEFLRDFGRLTFEFRYGSHTYTRRFSPEELDTEARRTEIDLRPKPTPSVAGVKRSEKEFTTRTVRELRALYEGRTAIQADKLMDPYKGLWIATEGNIGGIYPDGAGAVVSMLQGNDPIECRFSQEWARQLGRFNNGELLKVRGKISPNQNGQQIYLLECEIIS
jgi:hypothetical protein